MATKFGEFEAKISYSLACITGRCIP